MGRKGNMGERRRRDDGLKLKTHGELENARVLVSRVLIGWRRTCVPSHKSRFLRLVRPCPSRPGLSLAPHPPWRSRPSRRTKDTASGPPLPSSSGVCPCSRSICLPHSRRDEILNGKTLDRNSNYFAQYCFELGIDLFVTHSTQPHRTVMSSQETNRSHPRRRK